LLHQDCNLQNTWNREFFNGRFQHMLLVSKLFKTARRFSFILQVAVSHT